MNNDILGDEDLMTYAPGPDLTSILGRDLSTYHRMSGHDIIMNQVIQRKDVSPSSRYSSQGDNRTDPLNSSCQNNSKMDTPILNRKLHRTWSSSGFARKGEIRSKIRVTRKVYFQIIFRRKSSFGFGAAGEARENLLHEASKSKQ